MSKAKAKKVSDPVVVTAPPNKVLSTAKKVMKKHKRAIDELK